jgi:hypothetical protein
MFTFEEILISMKVVPEAVNFEIKRLEGSVAKNPF